MNSYIESFYKELYFDVSYQIAHDYNMKITYDEFMYNLHYYVQDSQLVEYIVHDEIFCEILDKRLNILDCEIDIDYDIMGFFHSIHKYENDINMIIRRKKIERLMKRTNGK